MPGKSGKERKRERLMMHASARKEKRLIAHDAGPERYIYIYIMYVYVEIERGRFMMHDRDEKDIERKIEREREREGRREGGTERETHDAF